MTKRLSAHFSRDEMTFSEAAVRKGIDNSPTPEVLKNLTALCENVLEPLRKKVGALRVSSGYRSPKLNKLIGGAATSQHCKGEAADIVPLTTDLKFAYLELIGSKIPFDQAIFEFGSWIHVSFSKRHRRQCLVATKVGNKTVYALFTGKFC